MNLLVKYLIKEIEKFKNINLILSGGESPIKYYKGFFSTQDFHLIKSFF
jgi:6-phosphogluconolactonase/glucosamine-6-phosphate isomerase/deaminase